jgi:F0F1-type ATP synthase assembly protein I
MTILQKYYQKLRQNHKKALYATFYNGEAYKHCLWLFSLELQSR